MLQILVITWRSHWHQKSFIVLVVRLLHDMYNADRINTSAAVTMAAAAAAAAVANANSAMSPIKA